jgi:MFS family permease
MRWRMLAWICLAELGALSLWFSATAVGPVLRTAWMSTSAQAWLSMAVTLGFVVGTVVGAVLTLTDFVGARRLFVLAAIGGAVVNLALLVVIDSLPLVLTARFLTGLAMAGTYPPAMKLAASWFLTGRGLAVGSLVGALTLGGALPHLLNYAGGLAWRPVIAGTSLAALGAAIVMATLVRDGPHVQGRAPFNPGCIRDLVRSRPVVLASFGYFGHMWELYAMWTWIGPYLLQAFTGAGLPAAPRLGALATTIVIGAGAVSCVLAGLAADRIGRTAVTMVAMVTSGACAASIGFAFDRPGWLVLVALVWGFTIVADSAQFSAAITELAPAAYVGTALSLQTSVGFLITLASTWLVPRAIEAWGWPWAFAFLAPGPVLGTLAMARLRRLPESARLAGGRR